MFSLVATWLFFPKLFNKANIKELDYSDGGNSDTWRGGGYLGLTPDKVSRINLNTFNETNLIYYSRVKMTYEEQVTFLDKVKYEEHSPSYKEFSHPPRWIPDKDRLRYIGLVVEDNNWNFHLYTDERDYLYLVSY